MGTFAERVEEFSEEANNDDTSLKFDEIPDEKVYLSSSNVSAFLADETTEFLANEVVQCILNVILE